MAALRFQTREETLDILGQRERERDRDRDRDTERETDRQTDRQRQRQRDRERERAVSYTHLTLPTNIAV